MPRLTVYRRLEAATREECIQEEDGQSRALIDEEYTSRAFYGSRRMAVFLRGRGHRVNRKRAQRLMREMGLAGMAPGLSTSKPHPQHKVYPYLLRGVAATRPNQVWSTDLTYIRLACGLAYLVAVIDWYSRRVLCRRISNSMDASFYVDCLEDALRHHGKPEVFNSDQGSQFTTDALPACSSARMWPSAWARSGAGQHLRRALVAQREVRERVPEGLRQHGRADSRLAQYLAFYNAERPHQAMGYETPDYVYRAGVGGGALIVDKFGDTDQEERRNGAASGSCWSGVDTA